MTYNSGVKCNVCECVHNREGLLCGAETIEVSKGQDLPKEEKPLESPHFCNTYRKTEQ